MIKNNHTVLNFSISLEQNIGNSDWKFKAKRQPEFGLPQTLS
jgi:hypothetical protein